LLKVLTVFSLGSLTGLVTLSHFLAFLLKNYRKITNATIIGFITGSLGVVWPWKKEIFKLNDSGVIAYDIKGNPILDNYERFIPREFTLENTLAVAFILVGIIAVIALGKYGERTRQS